MRWLGCLLSLIPGVNQAYFVFVIGRFLWKLTTGLSGKKTEAKRREEMSVNEEDLTGGKERTPRPKMPQIGGDRLAAAFIAIILSLLFDLGLRWLDLSVSRILSFFVTWAILSILFYLAMRE